MLYLTIWDTITDIARIRHDKTLSQPISRLGEISNKRAMVTKTILATLHLYIYCTMDCLHGCTITPINWGHSKFNLYVIYDHTPWCLSTYIYKYIQTNMLQLMTIYSIYPGQEGHTFAINSEVLKCNWGIFYITWDSKPDLLPRHGGLTYPGPLLHGELWLCRRRPGLTSAEALCPTLNYLWCVCSQLDTKFLLLGPGKIKNKLTI